METDILDRLYLEWSQFTQARTMRERTLQEAIQQALFHLKDATPKDRNGPCFRAIAILRKVVEEP